MYGPRLMDFVHSMEPAKEMFTAEILEFTKQFQLPRPIEVVDCELFSQSTG